MKETDTKKKASFVETRADGKNIQKDCLVDLQTGKIEVGGVKLAGLKYDEKSPVVAVRVEYRGTEFGVDIEKAQKGNAYAIKDRELGAFIMTSNKKKSDAELKEEGISNRWKPTFNQ